MKLHETFDTQVNSIRQIKGDRTTAMNRVHNAPSALGSGSYGTVLSKRSDPGTVIKVGTLSSSTFNKDGYLTYVKEIANLAKANPYFPRLYKIQFFLDSNNRQLFKITMERLEEFVDASTEDLLSIARHLFPENVVDKFEGMSSLFTPFVLVQDIQTTIQARGTQYFKDPKFATAMELITQLKHKHDLTLDFRAYNLMVRRTPYGPQLVITDPLV